MKYQNPCIKENDSYNIKPVETPHEDGERKARHHKRREKRGRVWSWDDDDDDDDAEGAEKGVGESPLDGYHWNPFLSIKIGNQMKTLFSHHEILREERDDVKLF
mgnify:CR=1 FL=1